VTPSRTRWLLLIHQLPREPAYLRVKIGRRLAQVGAVALKGSVYALPSTDAAMEDLQWVRQEILEGGGDATVAEAVLVEGLTDAEVEAKFREAADTGYAALAKKAREVSAAASRRKSLGVDERASLTAELGRLERGLEELTETDFFHAPGRAAVVALLDGLRAKAAPPREEHRAGKPHRLTGRTWVTRTGIHVDRIASAWLIRRSIDPRAVFKFVPAKGYLPRKGELRFDMFEAEYSHQGDRCTFETLIARFALAEPGLRALAEVIHDIDLKDSKFGRPETAGVAAAVAGLCREARDDEERLRRGSQLFEGLLADFAVRREAP